MNAASPPQRPASPSSSTVRPESLRAWVLASRPATLSAAIVPVAVGTACAASIGKFRPPVAVACLVGAMLLQIAANLANDVFDYEKGADTHERLGPTRAVQAGLLSARSVRRALVIVLGLALGVGVYLTAVAGWPVVVIGLLSIASALAYTGGPFPLGYHGLGDVFVMLFFGFVAVAATTWVQAAEIPPVTWLAALAVGSLATAVLVVNNLRDRDTDVRAGKRTLAVRFGKEAAIWEYKLLLGVALTMPLVVVYTRLGPVTVLLAAVTLPRALMLMMQIRRRDGKHLNPILVSTAQLLLTYGLSLAAGIALGGQRFG